MTFKVSIYFVCSFLSDFDECQSRSTNNCEQLCVNLPASFFCDCRDGYKLNADDNSCDGKGCNRIATIHVCCSKRVFDYTKPDPAPAIFVSYFCTRALMLYLMINVLNIKKSTFKAISYLQFSWLCDGTH